MIDRKELEYIVNGEMIVIEQLSQEDLRKIYEKKYMYTEMEYENVTWKNLEHIAVAIAKYLDDDGCHVRHCGTGGIMFDAYQYGRKIGQFVVYSEAASEHYNSIDYAGYVDTKNKIRTNH